jgi:hypothetical protein
MSSYIECRRCGAPYPQEIVKVLAGYIDLVAALKRIEMEALLSADPMAHLQICFDTAKEAIARAKGHL